MMMIFIDILVLSVLVFCFIYVSRKKPKGVSEFFYPFTFVRFITFSPIIVTFANLLLALFTSYTAWQAGIPLIFSFLLFLHLVWEKVKKTCHWVVYTLPLKRKVKTFMATEGFSDLFDLQVSFDLQILMVKLYKDDEHLYQSKESELMDRFTKLYLAPISFWGSITVEEQTRIG